jgi:hypothetical protein
VRKSFDELRARLLRGGVAPRHVRRYLGELADHLADLRAEEERGGPGAADAESAALARLGGIDALAEAMIQQRQLQALSARAPWAAFGLAPLIVLAGAYLLAGLILWTGWQIFLPGTASPFVPIHGLAIVYFGVGRLDYFGAPLFIGWAMAIFAARQRSPSLWPLLGLMLIALAGGVANFYAVPSAVAGEAGHVGIGFDLLSSSGALVEDLRHAVLIFTLTATPYLIWRLRQLYRLAA